MAIAIGDRLPSQNLFQLVKGSPESVSSDRLFADKKVILIAVPGPFTPICHEQHLPGYLETADAFFAKGVDLIACLAVNDAFVMAAWGQTLGAGDKILMLSDGNGDFTRAMGTQLDLSVVGLGVRSTRYVLYAENGVIVAFHNEGSHELTGSSAEQFLAQIPA